MSYYDEIEIEDMIFHKETSLYTYPCPCGDQFEILLQDLRDGEDVAVCPSCSLMIKVIFEAVRCFMDHISWRNNLNVQPQENLPAEVEATTTEPLAVAT